MKNAVNLLKKSIQYTWVSLVGYRIPMDPATIRSLRSRSKRISHLIAKEDLWSQWICRKLWGLDLWSERILDPDPWDQIPGFIFGIHGHVCSLLQLHTKSFCVLALQNSQFEASTSSRPQTVNFEALGHKAIKIPIVDYEVKYIIPMRRP